MENEVSFKIMEMLTGNETANLRPLSVADYVLRGNVFQSSLQKFTAFLT